MNTLRLILIFLSVTHFCLSQSIIDKYVDAIGGKGRIDSISTAILKVNLSSSHTSSATCVTSLKRDYKFRISLSYENGNGSIHCYNGEKHTGTNKSVLTIVETLNRKQKKFFVFNEVIFIPKSELKDEPDAVMNGIKCNVLGYNDIEKNEFHKYYFDVETHLLIAEDSSGYPTFYENYQATDGILFPMRSRQTIKEISSITEYTEIILNPDLSDDIFYCDPKK